MKIGVVADDLTGANATGIKLLSQGLVCKTIFHQTPIHNLNSEDAICIDTDSRYVSKDISSERVRMAALNLKNWGACILCKRIDSTIRGNIGSEIDAMLKIMGDSSVAIISPSYPDSGRVMAGGYLLVNKELVEDTDVAVDPIQPLGSSFVPQLLEKQSIHKTALIDLSWITQGSNAVENKIKELILQGIRLIVCDAVSDQHLDTIAKAMFQVKNPTLIPVDPGPLTNFYVQHKRGKEKRNDKPTFLFAVGSVTSATGNQLQYLMENEDVRSIIVNPDMLGTMGNSWDKEVARAVKEVERSPITESIILLTTNHPNHLLVDLKSKSVAEGVSADGLAKRIAEGLAEISKQLIFQSNGQIKGCFFSGGDVTASFCKVANVNGIRLKGEVIPLAAYGQLAGGLFDGLPVVTKGGMIGDQKTMIDIFKYLSSLLEYQRSVSIV